MVPPREENTSAAELGLKAMKKIKNAIPSQVRTFLIMAGLLLWVRGDGQHRWVLTVSASSLRVNNVAEKPIPSPQVRTPGSGSAMQVGRRRSVHKLGRHPFAEVVQDDMLGEKVTRACRPRYRIEPHSYRLTHVGASILRGLDAPQGSGVTRRFDLGVRPRMSTGVGQSLGDQISRVDAGNSREARAETHTRLLGDQD